MIGKTTVTSRVQCSQCRAWIDFSEALKARRHYAHHFHAYDAWLCLACGEGRREAAERVEAVGEGRE